MFLKELRESLAVKAVEVFDQLFGVESVKESGHRVIIRGTVCRDMYDDRPGVVFYNQDSCRSIDISPYIRANKVREFALEQFQLLKALDSGEELFDGRFTAESIEIVNGQGEVIDSFDQGKWVEGIEPDQLTVFEDVISELRRRASTEFEWDNHETSRRLFKEAHKLTVRISISRHRVGAGKRI